MKAIVKKSLATDAPLALVELPAPVPRANEVRVAIKAAGVNPADWKMLASGAASLAGRTLNPSGQVFAGMDFSGIIDATGTNVTRFKVGDPVAGATRVFMGQGGSWADTVVLPQSQVCPLPEGFDLVAAGALPVPGVTAWMAVVRIGRLKRGQKALILGASGGVGHLALQVAKHVCGAFTVGVCSARNIQLVQSLGADVAIDYGKGDALEQAQPHGPYQVVVDCVGDYSAVRCHELLTPQGRHVNIAAQSASAIAQMLVPPFRTRTLLGLPTPATLRPVIEAVASDRIKVIVSERIPLSHAEKAVALSQSGRVVGKIVLVP
ncbi:MAG: NAD(P)-dependent alcohol dehydrogenase [Deltaproteobacteria bacterium]|nr:NAD(P)-dependent alcohol dehydrogenase [Deltaproteobacteria bacterium]